MDWAKNRVARNILRKLIALFAIPYLWIMLRRVKLENIHEENQGNIERLHREGVPMVFAFHHGQLIPLVLYAIMSKRSGLLNKIGPVTILTSDQEGAIAGRLLEREGYQFITRNMSRAGIKEALEKCAYAIQRGSNLAMAAEDRVPDSYKIAKVKSGAVKIAAESGAALVPVAVKVISWSKTILRRKWDKMVIPLFFCKCRLLVKYGDPITSESVAGQERRAVTRHLQRQLDIQTERLEEEGATASLEDRNSLLKLLTAMGFFTSLFAISFIPKWYILLIGILAASYFAVVLIMLTRGYYSRVISDPKLAILEVKSREQAIKKYSELLRLAKSHVIMFQSNFNPHFLLKDEVFKAIEEIIENAKIEVLICGVDSVDDALASLRQLRIPRQSGH